LVKWVYPFVVLQRVKAKHNGKAKREIREKEMGLAFYEGVTHPLL